MCGTIDPAKSRSPFGVVIAQAAATSTSRSPGGEPGKVSERLSERSACAWQCLACFPILDLSDAILERIMDTPTWGSESGRARVRDGCLHRAAPGEWFEQAPELVRPELRAWQDRPDWLISFNRRGCHTEDRRRASSHIEDSSAGPKKSDRKNGRRLAGKCSK